MSNTILIIDNEERVVSSTVDHLIREGFEVITAVSPQSALRKIQHTPPHLILLNATVLESEGCGIIAQFRQQADMPIVLFAGYGTAVNVVDALDQGIDAVIVQPCSLREVSARIRAVLRRAGIDVSQAQLPQQEINVQPNADRLVSTIACYILRIQSALHIT